MVQLSQIERDIIEKNPLRDTLDQFHNVLRDSESSFTSGSTSRHETTSKGPEKSRLLAAASNKLLGHLVLSDAASAIPSRIGSHALASDLLEICLRLQTRDFDQSFPFALATCIQQWGQRRHVERRLRSHRHIHSRDVADQSPTHLRWRTITRSSASLEGSEQTRKNTNDELLHEIKSCIYRNVDGFFDKCFNGRD